MYGLPSSALVSRVNDLGEKILNDARDAKDYEGLKMDLLATMGIHFVSLKSRPANNRA